jgi:hypothetical protein
MTISAEMDESFDRSGGYFYYTSIEQEKVLLESPL